MNSPFWCFVAMIIVGPNDFRRLPCTTSCTCCEVIYRCIYYAFATSHKIGVLLAKVSVRLFSPNLLHR